MRKIEKLRLGDRVITDRTDNFGHRLVQSDFVNPARMRLVSLTMPKPGGGRAEIELLRSPDWIEDYGAYVGGSVFLDMPEMGVEGLAEVLAIEPCPPLEEGEGRLVTGTFQPIQLVMAPPSPQAADPPCGASRVDKSRSVL